MNRSVVAMLVTVLLPGLVQAQAKSKEEKAEIAATRQQRERGRLPAPLEEIVGNIYDLEESGHLQMTKVTLRTIDNGRSQAIVWKMRTKKTISCRLVVKLINLVRDARFYSTINGVKFERLSTLLNYSERIKDGADNGQLLRRDDVFEVWVELREVDQRKLIGQDVDTAIFGEWKPGRIGR